MTQEQKNSPTTPTERERAMNDLILDLYWQARVLAEERPDDSIAQKLWKNVQLLDGEFNANR